MELLAAACVALLTEKRVRAGVLLAEDGPDALETAIKHVPALREDEVTHLVYVSRRTAKVYREHQVALASAAKEVVARRGAEVSM